METPVDILIVDDHTYGRKTLANIVRSRGYRVVEAATGGEAVGRIAEAFFHVAIVDVRLPDMSGLEVLSSIKKSSDDTIVIIVTAYASMESTIEAMEKGAYSYAAKPLNIDNLLLTIEKGLEKQRYAMENKRLVEELRKANDLLRELDHRKSAFVANVSHEFKNPLAAIKESMAILLDGIEGDINAKQRDTLQAGKRATERLIRLVRDLLDLFKIETGKMDLRREQLSLAAVIDEVAAVYAKELDARKIGLTKDCAAAVGTVWADHDKMVQVLDNLVSNAIKYTPAGGAIAITLRGNEREIRCSVADTGPGIPCECFKTIFDKFVRITAERHEGTGLGLSITKDIVDLHKGKIWVESEVGHGSTFIFTIPRDLRHAA